MAKDKKYKVVLTDVAKAELEKIKEDFQKGIPESPYKEIVETIRYLSTVNPLPPVAQDDEEGVHRVRVDDYRIHYVIDEKKSSIVIQKVRMRMGLSKETRASDVVTDYKLRPGYTWIDPAMAKGNVKKE